MHAIACERSPFPPHTLRFPRTLTPACTRQGLTAAAAPAAEAKDATPGASAQSVSGCAGIESLALAEQTRPVALQGEVEEEAQAKSRAVGEHGAGAARVGGGGGGGEARANGERCDGDDAKKLVLDLLPLRYFEVTVLKNVQEMEEVCAAGEADAVETPTGGGQGGASASAGGAAGGGPGTQGWQGLPAMGSVNEWCLSVGVSLECFPTVGKQPGWDSHSAAVHSDDGRFYFANVHEAANLRFGPGDTVGCGLRLDLARPVMFYTLNGKFHSFVSAVSLSKQAQRAVEGSDSAYGYMYPTLGIDSLCPVKINTGTEPFVCDLTLQSIWAHLRLGRRARHAYAPPSTNTVFVERWIQLTGNDEDSDVMEDGHGPPFAYLLPTTGGGGPPNHPFGPFGGGQQTALAQWAQTLLEQVVYREHILYALVQ